MCFRVGIRHSKAQSVIALSKKNSKAILTRLKVKLVALDHEITEINKTIKAIKAIKPSRLSRFSRLLRL